ncbi:winged helix-turn-helix domain-containing protein [Bosea sp. (in: a-proteobacteria)]|jgi:molybdate transport system regulatory protein|uniref:winged helix-turn-helix domain-containing protein n=1 Tax=Bosea sp. (in: a-proteobacteria) TaxID=1871050 RepID=UPI002DDCF5EA|nr:winged helix-turn-helix domain-containing protein [Bosea sp. (in: a-proteobacteria)]HEV2510032.1 winged helix-turn-helix domain-containing protein [Bosea sp. (in: a-proteobacteria)]
MSKADQSLPAVRFSFRLDFTPGGRLGPGKVQLLEAIGETGSISAAGRSMKMSYRRAWLLVDDLNRIFRAPLVEAQPGGAKGGGAHLTALGREIVANYRAIEAKTLEAGAAEIAALRAAVSPTAPPREPGKKA